MATSNLILDRYEPIGTAGSGGFGTVQIAWDPRIQRKVAIKTIQLTEQDAYRAALPGAQAVSRLPQQSSTADRWHGIQPWDEYLAAGESADGGPVDEAFQPEPETFHAMANLPGLDEARTAAMLADPRIVTVYDFEVRGRVAYLIMEYVEGVTLTKVLRDYADWLTIDVVTSVFDSVAGALETAHEGGVLHLDIKPDNILINAKGEVKVTDFGLATLADTSGAGTTGGGTIGYMPLEQMRREHLDARTDEWSLASVAYEMLTGDNPFLTKDLSEAELAIEDAELILPSLCWEGVDSQIDDVMFYALDPDRDERYASVRDFAEEMDKFLGDARSGKDQLAEIVEDALGLVEYEDEWEDDDAEPPARAGFGIAGFLKSLIGGSGQSEPEQQELPRNAVLVDAPAEEETAGYEEDYEQRPRRSRREPREHVPVRDRTSERMQNFAARAWAVLASGALAFFAASNLGVLSAFGSGQLAVVVALALAAAGLAAVRPHIGALVAYGLLGVTLIANGAFAPAVVLVVALIAWWYFIARTSVGSSNLGLAAPLLGAVGGSSAVPLLAGAALRPVQAIATTAFAAVVAMIMGSLGSGSLLGWAASAHWLFGDADIMSSFVRLLTRASTWCIVVGWIAAAAVQSFLATRGRRWMEVVGLVLAAIIIAAATIAFDGVSVQLVVSLVAGVLVLLATML